MAETIYHTRYEVRGPWLISSKDLDSLDHSIARITQMLRDMQAEKLRDEAEQYVEGREPMSSQKTLTDEERISQKITELRYKAEDPNPTVEVLLHDSRVIRGKSITEMREHSDIASSRIAAMTIEYKAYPYCSVDFGLVVSVGSLSIKASPPENHTIVEAFNILRNWAVAREPPTWQRKWASFAWLFWAALTALFGAAVAEQFGDTAADQQRAVAKMLLQGGIDQSKVPQAIELLLRADYNLSVATAGAVKKQYPYWFLFVLLLGLIMYYARPRTAVGLGRTLRSPERWRGWMTFASFTFPGALITTLVMPWIYDWLKAHFP